MRCLLHPVAVLAALVVGAACSATGPTGPDASALTLAETPAYAPPPVWQLTAFGHRAVADLSPPGGAIRAREVEGKHSPFSAMKDLVERALQCVTAPAAPIDHLPGPVAVAALSPRGGRPADQILDSFLPRSTPLKDLSEDDDVLEILRSRGRLL